MIIENSNKGYNTKQRNVLIDYFRRNGEYCFSAGDIISNEELDIPVATVYRMLARLTSEGIINKFIGDGSSGATYRYNGAENCNSHFHLKCLACGKLIHMGCDALRDLGEHIKNEHDFFIDNSKTIIYGICKECKQKDNQHKTVRK